eukprot:4417144-Amphidinium_carterae.1
MVYVLKPDADKAPGPNGPAMKYKSRMVICGNRQPWEQTESNWMNNIDAPLIRWMFSAFCAAPRLWEQSGDTKFASCEFKVDKKVYSLKQSILAPSLWWILPIPLSEQKHRLPKKTPDKRSDEHVTRWTEA